MNNPEGMKKGDRVVCLTDDLFKAVSNRAPRKNNVVTIHSIRIMEKVGYCISIEECYHDLHFSHTFFSEHKVDHDFVNDLIEKL